MIKRRIAMSLLLALFVASAQAQEVRIRCKWTSPNDRSRLDMAFAGNPLLVMLPGETLEVTAEANGIVGQVTILKDGLPYREDAVLQFTAPDRPGAYFIPLNLAAGDARREGKGRSASSCPARRLEEKSRTASS